MRKEIVRLRDKADRLLQLRYVKLNPICYVCGKPTQVMHHYVYKSHSNNLRYDPDNLISLCNSCHFKHHWVGDSRIVATILRKKGFEWERNLNIKRYIIIKLNKEYLLGKIAELSPD